MARNLLVYHVRILEKYKYYGSSQKARHLVKLTTPAPSTSKPAIMGHLTDDQFNAISIMERTCSVISLLGCIFTIVTFICLSAFRAKPVNRLVFFASLGNMGCTVGTLMSRSFLDDIDSFGCQFQAMLVQWFVALDTF